MLVVDRQLPFTIVYSQLAFFCPISIRCNPRVSSNIKDEYLYKKKVNMAEHQLIQYVASLYIVCISCLY